MKKKVGNVRTLGKLCVMGAALSTGQAAMAQTSVQVYGLVDSYVGVLKRSDQPASAAVVNGGGTATSYWGIRGTEDLGGSLKAIFVLESFFQPDTGTQGRNATDPLFSKDAYVGLSGPFGQITAGRHTIPLFNAEVATNPFGGSLQFSPLMLQSYLPTFGRNVLADSKWDNSVQYTTPTMNGFRITGTLGMGEVSGQNGTNNVGLAGNYANGPLTAVVVAQRVRTGIAIAPATPQQTVLLAGGTYDFSVLKLFGTYYQAQTQATNTKDKTIQVGVSVPVLTADKVSASWANSRIDSKIAANHVMRTGFTAGYEHAMSKTTALYGIYMLDKLTAHGSGSNYGVGIRHLF